MDFRTKKTKIPSRIALAASLIRFALFALPHSQYERLSSRAPLGSSESGQLVNWSITVPGIFSIFAILLNSIVLVVSVTYLLLGQPYSHKLWNTFLLFFFFLETLCEACAVLYSCTLVQDGVPFIQAGNYVALVFNILWFVSVAVLYYPLVLKPAKELKEYLNSIKLPKEEKAQQIDDNKITRRATIDTWVEEGRRSKEEGEKRKDAIRKK